MKLTIDTPTGNTDSTDTDHSSRISIFGISDFQATEEDVTLFFPTTSALDEITIPGRIVAGLEEHDLDDLTYCELLEETTYSHDHVIVVYSPTFPDLEYHVATTISDAPRKRLTVVEQNTDDIPAILNR